MDIKKDFGLRLKELRNKRNITQFQLAELAGIDPKHLSHIETGKSFPKADLIERLSIALEVDYLELFNTKHLQTRDDMIKTINSALKKLSDEELRKVFKLLFSVLN